MLQINEIKNTPKLELIKEAKMAELDLQRQGPKAKERNPSWKSKPLVEVISENNQKCQIQIQRQWSISPRMPELEGREVSNSQCTNT